MSDLVTKLRLRCQQYPKVLGLPESDDPRVLRAGLELVAENAVKQLYLFHDRKTCTELSRSFDGVLHLHDPRIVWFNLRHHPEVVTAVQEKLAVKGRTMSTLHVATYLLATGQLDTVCAGATYTTADVIRAALTFLELAARGTVSGSFLLSRQQCNMMFADCAVIIDPDSEQLAAVAASTVETFRLLFPDATPKVAFLSFSTKGSAQHPRQQKVRAALELFQQKFPQISSDGELQFDAAVDPAIALQKSSQAKIRGDANCFIFPNLDAGNIGYKICQRMGNFAAFGPILQGFTRPLSDLSRGASSFEIKIAAYISLCRAISS